MKIGRTIYLDHQATTPVDRRVLDQMLPHFTDSFGNPHSADHVLGWESARTIQKAAERVGRLIGADPDEIIFTSGATESNNLALLGLARRATGGSRRRVLVSAIEHKCVLAVGRVLHEQHGFKVEKVPVDQEGFVDLSALELMLGDDVLVVSIMAVNNEIGAVQDVETVSKLARAHGAIFHCDAAQAPIAMNTSNLAAYADLLSLSAHKMYGPKGIGVLRVARELVDRIEPLIYGGEQQNGLRSGTVPVPLCVGMGAAAELVASEEFEERRTDLRRQRDAFVRKLSGGAYPAKLNGPSGDARHPGNVNVCFPGLSAQDILVRLQPHLAASTGSACTSGISEPSHVLKAIGLTTDQAESSIRFSLGPDTNDSELEEAAILVEEAIEGILQSDVVRSA